MLAAAFFVLSLTGNIPQIRNMEILREVLIIIVTSLASGGLVWVFTLKYTRQQAKADAMKSMQDIYQELIADLKSELTETSAENKQLKEQITLLLTEQESERVERRHMLEKLGSVETKAAANSKNISKLLPMACGRTDCNKRIGIPDVND